MAKTDKVKKANPLLDDEETTETATPKKGAVKAKAPVKKAKVETTEDEEEVTDEETDTEDEEVDADTDETEDTEDDADEEDEMPAPKAKKTAKPVEKVNVAESMLTDIETTKRALAKEPKVRIFIPLGIGEVRGAASAIETVTINGYRQVFKKGEYHTVAQSVADQIEQHYNMTAENTEAGMRTRLDHPRVQDGMSTDDALL